MNGKRTWAVMLALAATASIQAQSGKDLVVKAFGLTAESAKSFLDGGKPIGHFGQMSRTYFKLTGSWANRCPNVMGMSVTFVRGKVDDANVYFKPNVSLSVGLKEMGLSAGALSPPVHMGAPRTLHHKPMTPAMLATYPTEQTLTGVTVRGAKRILVIVYPKAGVQISFMGR